MVAGCAAGFRAGTVNVTPTGANLVGVVASDRSEAGTYFFKYGPLSASSHPSATPMRPRFDGDLRVGDAQPSS